MLGIQVMQKKQETLTKTFFVWNQKFSCQLLRLNINGESANTRVNQGFEKINKYDTFWLNLIYYFNHVEMAAKTLVLLMLIKW